MMRQRGRGGEGKGKGERKEVKTTDRQSERRRETERWTDTDKGIANSCPVMSKFLSLAPSNQETQYRR